MTAFLIDTWQYDVPDEAADPGSGKFRTDSVNHHMYLSEESQSSVNVDADMAEVAVGDRVLVQEVADATNWFNIEVLDPLIDHGTWWEMHYTVIQAGNSVGKNKAVQLAFAHPETSTPVPIPEPTSEIDLLRVYLADPVLDAEGNPITPFFSDEFLADLLEKFGDDIYGAAAEGWVMKAAAAAELVNASTDNSTFSLSDIHKHCMAMVDYYSGLSTSGSAFGVGQLINVGMASQYKSSQEDEGDDIVG